MATLEQVEKLREKAHVSFEEAKAALDAVNGDLLDALIYLEKEGKVNPPAGDGYYSSEHTTSENNEPDPTDNKQYHQSGAFKEMLQQFGRFCAKIFRVGNTNYLVAEKNGGEIFACPITAVVLLVIFFFWVVVPLFVISLFFNFRYRIRGSEMGTDSVNKVMDGASETVEDIKKNFTGGQK